MQQTLMVNKYDNLKSIRLDMYPAEALIVLDALRKYSRMVGVHDIDAKMAERMRQEMLQSRIRCKREENEE